MFEQVLSFAWWLVLTAASSVILFALSTAVLFWFHGRLESTKSYRDLPTIRTRPVLTYWEWLVTFARQKSPREFLMRVISSICMGYREQRIVVLWIFLKPIIFFFVPETVEVLLNNSKTISKAAEYRFVEPWLGNGLLISTGDKWRKQRKLLTPTFHFQILETFLTTFNEEAGVLTRKFAVEVGKPWFDVVDRIKLCTLDIICQTAMGVHLNIQSGQCQDYVQRIDQVSDVFFYRVIRPWLWPDIIFYNCSRTGWEFRKNVNAMHDFTRKVIKEKKESLLMEATEEDDSSGKPEKKKKKAFLELLLELHLKDGSLTEENIREEVDTFMFEGHDTTAMAISWMLYELGLHPEIQNRLYEEQEGIYGGDKERAVTLEDMKHMKYLECVIKETLRLYPSVPFIGRQLTENLEVGNYSLAPGCSCFICIMTLHRDPEQFPRPEVFDPDRFLPENCSKRHPYAYIPFSAGPRNCIGQKFAMMEEKTLVSHIVRKFKITSLDNRDKIEIRAGIVLKNTDPIRIRLELREDARDPQRSV